MKKALITCGLVLFAILTVPMLLAPSSGGGGSSGGSSGSGSNSVVIVSGTNTLVTASTNGNVITFKVSLTDPVALNQLVTTNTVVPTNTVSDGTTVDYSRSEWTLLLTSNLVTANLSHLTNGYYNATIWHVKGSGADRTITTSWTNSPNPITTGYVITVTNGQWVDILFSCQPLIDTNGAVRSH